jgi:signal transduction histidine kinase
VLADEERLRQMMMLLLDNAVKFGKPGDEITIKACKKGEFAAIEVQDTGPGVPEDEQEWLFKPYSRPRHEGKHMSGLGLGLSLFKTLAELHGGEVWVKSQTGKGATFGFTIPLYKDGNKPPDT